MASASTEAMAISAPMHSITEPFVGTLGEKSPSQTTEEQVIIEINGIEINITNLLRFGESYFTNLLLHSEHLSGETLFDTLFGMTDVSDESQIDSCPASIVVTHKSVSHSSDSSDIAFPIPDVASEEPSARDRIRDSVEAGLLFVSFLGNKTLDLKTYCKLKRDMEKIEYFCDYFGFSKDIFTILDEQYRVFTKKYNGKMTVNPYHDLYLIDEYGNDVFMVSIVRCKDELFESIIENGNITYRIDRNCNNALMLAIIHANYTATEVLCLNKKYHSQINVDGDFYVTLAPKSLPEISSLINSMNERFEGLTPEGNNYLMHMLNYRNHRIVYETVDGDIISSDPVQEYMLSIYDEYDLEITNNEGKTTLMLALEKNYMKLAVKIIKKPCKHTAVANNGKSALHYAQKASENVIRFLIDNGCPFSIDEKGESPSFAFLRSFEPNPYAYLIFENDSNIRTINYDGASALLYCSKVDDSNKLLDLGVPLPSSKFVHSFITFIINEHKSEEFILRLLESDYDIGSPESYIEKLICLVCISIENCMFRVASILYSRGYGKFYAPDYCQLGYAFFESLAKFHRIKKRSDTEITAEEQEAIDSLYNCIITDTDDSFGGRRHITFTHVVCNAYGESIRMFDASESIIEPYVDRYLDTLNAETISKKHSIPGRFGDSVTSYSILDYSADHHILRWKDISLHYIDNSCVEKFAIKLLQRGFIREPDDFIVDGHNNTLLILACRAQMWKLARMMIEKGFYKYGTDICGMSALAYAELRVFRLGENEPEDLDDDDNILIEFVRVLTEATSHL